MVEPPFDEEKDDEMEVDINQQEEDDDIDLDPGDDTTTTAVAIMGSQRRSVIPQDYYARFPNTPHLLSAYSRIVSPSTFSRPTLGPEACVQLLDYMEKKYLNAAAIADNFEKFAWETLELDPTNLDITYKELANAKDCVMWKVQSVLLVCLRVQSENPEDALQENTQSLIAKMCEVISCCFDTLYSKWRSAAIVDLHTDMHVPNEVRLHKFSCEVMSDHKKTPYQKLILYCLQKMHEHNYRKRGEDVYEELSAKWEGRRYGTRAWVRKESIKETVYRFTSSTSDKYEQFITLTGAGSGADKAAEFLKNCVDPKFPSITPSRHLFSFANGVLHTLSQSFIPYDKLDNMASWFPEMEEAAKLEGPDMVKKIRALKQDLETKTSCRFLNQIVEDSWVDPDTDWMNIPTPAFETILEPQNLGHEEGKSEAENAQAQFLVHMWIYVFIGRMLYGVGELEDWQIMFYIRGIANTGKSTIGKVVANFFSSQDVGILANNMEQIFGLQSIYDKFIWLSLETKSNFRLDQGVLQSMITGEMVNVAIKNKAPVFVKWSAPGLMIGNELPAWVNALGSMTRRLMLVDFKNRVPTTDHTLSKRLAEETAALIIKCNRAYQWAVSAHPKVAIETIVPKYFTDKQMELERETDTLLYFITCGSVVARDTVAGIDDPTAPYISLSTFRQLYTEWIKKTYGNTRRMVNTNDQNVIANTLKRAGLHLVEDTRRLGQTEQYSTWVVGLRQCNVVEIEQELNRNNTTAIMNGAFGGGLGAYGFGAGGTGSAVPLPGGGTDMIPGS